MNDIIAFKAKVIFEKIKKIDNSYDLLTEIYNDNINCIKEPNLKYFILTIFFHKNSQLPFNEVWKLFKVLISVNPNILKEQSENNEMFAVCLKNCTKLLLNAINNLNIDKNFGFKNKEISSTFDFLFSLPLVKYYINLVGVTKQKEEIFELLNQIGKALFEKIQFGKNNVIKNMFDDFYHFLNINDINPKNNKIISNEDKKIQKTLQSKKTNLEEKKFDKIKGYFNQYLNILDNKENKDINIMNNKNNISNIIFDDISDNIFFSKPSLIPKKTEKKNKSIKPKKEVQNEIHNKGNNNKIDKNINININNINNIPE